MSIDNLLGAGQSLSNLGTGALNVAGRVLNDTGLGGAATAVYWKDRLRPASFRGVPFGVLESQVRFGRRIAVHDYPYRDTVWVEDMGRAARRIAFSGFLVGDDCIEQRDLLMRACEEVDAVNGAELVHPTLGRINVSLLDDVTSVEKWDRGRVFEITFSFIEQGKRIFPSLTSSTADVASTAAQASQAAVSADFAATVAGTLKAGLGVVAQAVNSVGVWTRAADRLVSDATNLYHFVQALPGSFGRLFGAGIVRSSATGASVQSLIAKGAVGRSQVGDSNTALASAAAAMGPLAGQGNTPATAAVFSAYASAGHALAGAVAAAAPSPPDALRLLVSLVKAAPVLDGALTPPSYPITQVSPIPAPEAAAAMAAASSDLFRRAGLIALVQATTTYQPDSYDDAAAVRALVVGLLDVEMGIAGDQGQDATYNAFRAMRTAVVQDLTARGANLATLAQVVSPQPVPALVLAQRLYRDPARADQLITQAAPIHPAFMPVTFRALAK